jgi:hypothetical protein
MNGPPLVIQRDCVRVLILSSIALVEHARSQLSALPEPGVLALISGERALRYCPVLKYFRK